MTDNALRVIITVTAIAAITTLLIIAIVRRDGPGECAPSVDRVETWGSGMQRSCRPGARATVEWETPERQKGWLICTCPPAAVMDAGR
jgi:hypothetical protein